MWLVDKEDVGKEERAGMRSGFGARCDGIEGDEQPEEEHEEIIDLDCGGG